MEVSDKWFAIVNPVAGNGKGLADWPLISRLMRENGIIPDYAFTEHKYHAIELAVDAITQGYRHIIAIGGDGTLHEIVNAVFIQKTVPTTDISIGVIATGTGNDWIRMFGVAKDYAGAIKSIAEGYTILQDVGEVSYHKATYKQSRYIVNTAGVGLDACIVKKVTRQRTEGRNNHWAYRRATLKSIFRYRPTGVKIWVDDQLVANDLVISATIGIGKYSGGGMQQAPKAIADDGLFDLTTIRRMSKLRAVSRTGKIYNGRVYELEQASHNRGRNIRIESSPEIGLEVDGEPLGYSPFEFNLIDKAIKVIVSKKHIDSVNHDDNQAVRPELS